MTAHAFSPSLVITNANIRTMDANLPRAEALAAFADQIVAVGSNADISKSIGRDTRVVDGKGRLVLPGFNDAHVHFLSGGFQLANIDLREAKSAQDFSDRIRRFAATRPKDRWITGGDWDHERWPGTPLPTKQLIDAATTNAPVFVRRLDGHMAVANSLALRLANITRETQSPPGGEIVRDASGEPTGLLKDAAMALVNRLIPEPTFDEKQTAAKAATEHAASLGVTSVQDMSAGEDVGVYQQLLERGELKTRIYAVWPLPQWERLAATGIRAAFGNSMLRTGGLKGFSDGSLGSTTALFFAPYDDAPETAGLPADEMFPQGAMLARVKGAHAAGLQVMVHAIGDKANNEMLGIFEQVGASSNSREHRFRIEHAQHISPSDIQRFGKLKVIASMQPYHAADDGRWAEKRIGVQRCKTTYAFRSLLDSGATLAFGSDWTVAPLNPLQGIVAAVTRRTLDGKHPGGWIPEQKITVEEAVRAYTVGAAFAEFAEDSKGTIVPGKLADLIIISHDIFSIDPVEIDKAGIDLTIVGGRVVHERR